MSPRKEDDVPQHPKAADGVSEILWRACHDLRGPLRSIRSSAELLLRDGLTKETAEFQKRLGFIVEGAAKIERLADGLTSYGMALQIGREGFQSMRMDVLLRAVLAKLDRALRDAGASVSYGNLPRILGNPDRLMQVFDILLRNAIEHRGQEPPQVHISAEQQPDGWVFAVRDNGRGIESVYLESIFTPFARLNGAEGAGAGLGLTICRAIVEGHGGKIWAESNAEGGSTFLFTLPAE